MEEHMDFADDLHLADRKCDHCGLYINERDDDKVEDPPWVYCSHACFNAQQ
jgi:hypothetical protein